MEHNAVPDEDPACLLYPSNLEVCQDEQIVAVLPELPGIDWLIRVLVLDLVLIRLIVVAERHKQGIVDIGAVPANLLVRSDLLELEKWVGKGSEEVDVGLDCVPDVLLTVQPSPLEAWSWYLFP